MDNTVGVGVGHELQEDGYNKLKEELRNTTNENEYLLLKTHEQQRSLDEATGIISDLTQECEIIQRKIDKLNQQKYEQEQVIRELKKKNVSPETFYEPHENMGLILNENKTLKADIVLLKTAYSECKKLQSQPSENMLENHICEKNVVIAKLDMELDVANDSVVVLREQLLTVQTDLKNTLEQLSDRLQRNHEQKRSLDEATCLISDLTQECDIMQRKIDELKKEKYEQEQLVRELHKKLRSFEHEANLSQASDFDYYVSVETRSEPHENMGLLLNENKTLKADIVLLKTAYSECKQNLEKFQSQPSKNMLEDLICEKNVVITKLDIELTHANDSVVVLEDQLKTMQTDLRNTLEQLAETKDDLAKAQSDLHVARAPVMQSRGNSIFSELEDNRLKYVHKYNDLKSKYTEQSKKCIRQSQDISKLMGEKVSAARLIEDMATEEEEAHKALIDALESRIQQLEEYNKQVISELKIPIRIVSEVDSDTLKYVATIIADTKTANWALKKELDDRSIALLLNQQLTNKYFTDLRRYKAENLKLKCELNFKKSAVQDNLDVEECKTEYNTLNAKVEPLSNTLQWHMDSSSTIETHEEILKISKKLAFSDESPNPKSEMQNATDAVVVVCNQETAHVIQGNGEESIVVNAPIPVSKAITKKSYPRLAIRFKK